MAKIIQNDSLNAFQDRRFMQSTPIGKPYFSSTTIATDFIFLFFFFARSILVIPKLEGSPVGQTYHELEKNILLCFAHACNTIAKPLFRLPRFFTESCVATQI
jgi:hypothetical protein